MTPTPPSRKGRRPELAYLVALSLILCGIAYMTLAGTPTNQELLDTVRSSKSPEHRVYSMHALVLRGYFEERPFDELLSTLDDGPQLVAQYVHRVHLR